MTRTALYIVEGKKCEPRFLGKMWSTSKDPQIEIYSYGTNLHLLIKTLFDEHDQLDEDLDLQSCLILSEKDETEKEKLRGNFNDIFLVFDLDPQDSTIDLEKVMRMLQFFDDSADNGKLYINYPMLESYRHIAAKNDPEFRDRTVAMSDIPHYKEIVDSQCMKCLKQLNRYDDRTFRFLTLEHLKKVNRIISNRFILPDIKTFETWTGVDLLNAQLDKLREDGCLFVVNTCLFGLVEYRPSDYLNTKPSV